MNHHVDGSNKMKKPLISNDEIRSWGVLRVDPELPPINPTFFQNRSLFVGNLEHLGATWSLVVQEEAHIAYVAGFLSVIVARDPSSGKLPLWI